MGRYVRALGQNIARLAGGARESRQTLYIGGGTPTALPSKLLEYMLSNILDLNGFMSFNEATIEANPRSLTRQKLEVIGDSCINRLSIGIQSFRDPVLGRLGRAHTGDESRSAVDLARRMGVDNISIDLIYGVPGQSLRDWESDLREAVAVAPDHISLYGLTVEEGTPFEALEKRGDLSLPAEEEIVDMYRLAWDLLGEEGWNRYEFSNWALPGRECRHNLDCWRLSDYDGAGVAAHGFRRRPTPLRYGNVEDVEEYIARAAAGRELRAFTEELDERTVAAEGLMLGLRTAEGIDLSSYTGEFGLPPDMLFSEALQLGRRNGWLIEEQGLLRFSFEGVIFSNEVFQLLF